MLNCRILFLLVSFLTIANLTFAHTEAVEKKESVIESSLKTQNLADPNTKISDVAPLNEKAPVQIGTAKESPKESLTKSNGAEAVATLVKQTAQNVEALPDLQVLEFVLADNIVEREPKNVVENFKQDNQRGFAFARLSSLKQADITFIWLRDGKEQTRFTTTIHASKKWRTFSATKLNKGEWTVRLVSGDKIIAEKSFSIQ